MNPIEQLVRGFQDLVAYVPELVQPFVILLAGAIPFVEGEVASMVGVVGGVNPIIAGIAAAAGNFISVLLIVMLTSRARTAVVDRQNARVAATVGGGSAETAAAVAPEKPESKGRVKFKRWLVRFGVPGASILGPLAIPTQFTSAILVAGGTPRGWVLLWQGVAIVLWTTVGTVSVWAALTFLVGV
ncbi:small multidrug efflux protein [Microbacterium sp. NPDC089695]|uniref:small multidrug efflux protein n=1 Tax=Microbacterium sp. NPDC089695 TaxID=3364198 RepID=UPI0037F5C78D